MKYTIILLAFILFSCGARKADKSVIYESKKKELETEKVISDNTTIKETSKTEDNSNTTIKEIIYEPSDNTKPSTITDEKGNITVLSNVKKIVKEITVKNNIVKQEAINIGKEVNTIESEKAKEVIKVEKEEKHVEREAFSYLNLLWLIIPITIVYLFWRVSKKLNL